MKQTVRRIPRCVSLTPTWLGSVHLLDCWTSSAASCTAHVTTRHAAFRHTTTACSLVDLHHDRVHNALELLLPCFKLVLLSKLVLVEPIECLLNSLLDLV